MPAAPNSPRPLPDSLTDVLVSAVSLLAAAASDPAHPARKLVLASISDGHPRARTLILRAFDGDTRTIRLHTDARSGKCAELDANPGVAVHFYDPDADIQVLLKGVATVHRSDRYADAAWAGSTPASRRAYMAVGEPGSPSPEPVSGLPAEVEGRVPEAHEVEPSRHNFAAIEIRFDELEWLALSPAGNRRARFRWSGDERKETWLVP